MGASNPERRAPDRLVRTISRDGGIAVRAIVGTGLVAEAARRHDTSPTATAALGRTLLGALLLAASGKSGESVQIQFRGNGPLRSVVALADDAGRARGYVLRPRADPPRVNGQLDVHNAVGAGVLTVVRQRPGQLPYTGVVQILYGTIARDLTHYLAESEQINTAVALGVQQGDAGGIQAAAGYFVHALPGASAAETRRAELNVHSASHPSELVAAGADARDLIERLLDGLGHREYFESEVSFRCNCDASRVAAAVRLLGEDEISKAARDGEALEVRCEFCAESYTLEPDALRALIRSA
jgi:molecular chaperone Hsp33